MRKGPTLQDIAELAGVTKSTVSRVLNNQYSINIPHTTRMRIMKIAAEMQYQPNAAARALKTRSTRAIGLYVRSAERLRDMHLQVVVSGISEAIVHHDASIIWYFGPSNRPGDICFTQLYDGRIDAGIILEDRGTTPEVLHRASQARIPLVFIGNYGDARVHYVGADDFAGARAAAYHLADCGHTEMLCLCGTGTLAGEQRTEGFRLGLQERGLLAHSTFIDIDFKPDLAYKAVQEVFRRPAPPTAVFAVNDLSALAAIQAINAAGLSVPEEVSVVGFNNLSFTAFSQPALTTVHRPLYNMGVEAAHLVLRLLAEAENAAQSYYHRILPAELVVRASSGPAPIVRAQKREA